MLSANPLSTRLKTTVFVLAMIAAFGFQLRAQDSRGSHETPYVDDWTHHRLVYSNPGTREDAQRQGRLDQWQKFTNDPRYQLQKFKRTAGPRHLGDHPADGDGPDIGWDGDRDRDHGHHGHKASADLMHKDWSTPLGSGTTSTQTGTFTGLPTVNQTATITNGGNALVLTAQNTTTPGTGTITDNRNGVSGSTITIGAVTYSWVAGAPAANYQIRQDGTSHAHNAQNLYAAISGNPALCYTAGCITAGTVAQTGVTAAWSAADDGGLGDQVTVSNTNAGLTWSTSNTTYFTLAPLGTLPGQTTTTNTCSSSTAGTFIIGASAAATATNMISAISACETSYPAVGVTAASGGSGIVNLSAASVGTGGNSITTTDTLTNFSWGAGTLAGGAVATVQPNAAPAKFGPSLTTASCANDFVVYPTGQAGSTSSANIIAYNNIYAGASPGCGTSGVPAVYWAYNTESGANTGYAVTTSPILSLDGTKVAFVQSNGTSAQLVVLKWVVPSAGTLTSPLAPTASANIAVCTAPCMTVTALTNNDTYSAPFYDYNSADDALYVGDDLGDLEKFTGVFNGAISAATAINLGNTNPLSSPVFDLYSGCVFVGDSTGYLYSVNSGNGGQVCTSTSFTTRGHTVLLSDGGAGGGIYDAPIVDPFAGSVYAFVASNAASTTTVVANEGFNSATLTGTGSGGSFTLADVGKAISGTNIPGGTTITAVNLTGNTTATISNTLFCFAGCNNITFTITLASGGFNTVDQFAVGTITQSNTTAAPVATQEVGTGGDGYNLYAGTFDNVYYGSTSSTSPTGSLYVIGNTGVTTGATLYRIPITSGVMGAPIAAVTGLTPNAANAYPWPSPLTEFCNGTCTVSGGVTTSGTDYVFFSVNRGTGASCTATAGNFCIESYSVSNPASLVRSGAQDFTNVGTNGCWGTGGIVIDNDAATTGSSQIYFINLNGAAAGGGSGGGTTASANCTAGGAPTINAIQGAQNVP